jgi:hypothetical protein
LVRGEGFGRGVRSGLVCEPEKHHSPEVNMLPAFDLLINAALLRLHMDLFYVFPAMVVVGWFIAFANRNRA